MDNNNNNNIINNNTNNNNNNNNPPPPPLRLPPLPLPPPPPPETFSVPPFNLSPFPPPTTPTTASTSSPSSSHHRRKRSKLVPVDPPQPSTAVATTPTRTPSRRPDPLAPKITPPCTECGKTFWSWKALFGHMRCHPERQWRGINPPPHLRRDSPPPPPPPPPTEDDRVVAASLILLSTSNGGIAGGGGGGDDQTNGPARFECSSCKKTFPSHQALGGHRASHKNVKGCFAITKSSGVEEQGGNSMVEGQSSNFPVRAEEAGPNLGLILSMGHRCGICMKVFTSGQALGGHMRCHWEKNEDVPTTSFGPGPEPGPVSQPEEAQCVPDLNLPLQVPEDAGSSGGSPSDIQLDLRLGR